MITTAPITEESIRERLAADKAKPSRLATWDEIEYLLDLLDQERAIEWEPTRWWRAVAPDGSIWCETSEEAQVREYARPGDRIFRLVQNVRHEWQEQP